MVNKVGSQVPNPISSKEFEEGMRYLIRATTELVTLRKKSEDLEERKREIFDKLHEYVKDSINPYYSKDAPRPYNRKYLYSVSFRIPVEERKGSSIGFFFNTYSGGTRAMAKDYRRLYSNKFTGPHNVFLIADFAEEIISKARKRMKLSKYTSKYDLSHLIDTLHSLIVIRGNNYFVRDATPPAKYIPNLQVDPVTGEKRKASKAKTLYVPFSISIKKEDET